MRVQHKVFRGVFNTWEHLFDEAAWFASTLGPERLIGISHSDNGEGVVVVWYWDEAPKRPQDPGA